MRTGRAVALKGAADLGARAVSLVTFPLVVERAGAAGYGAYSQMIAVIGFLVPFASLGLGSASVQFFAPGRWTAAVRRRVRRASLLALLFSLAFGCALTAGAGPLNDTFLKWPDGDSLFKAGGLLLAVSALEFALLELLRARRWLGTYVVCQSLQALVTAGGAVAMVAAEWSIVGFVVAVAAVRGLLLLVEVVAVLVAFRTEDGDEEPGERMAGATSVGAMVRFGLPLAVAGIGLSLVHVGDRLIIGRYLDARVVGVYSAVYGLGLLVAAAAGPLMLAAYPAIVRARFSGSAGDVPSEVRRFHRFIALVVVLTTGYLCVVMEPMLRLLGGRAFSPALVVVIPIVVGLALDQWNGLAHYVLAAAGRNVLVQNAWIACGAGNVALNVVVVPRWGLEGAAVLTLLTFAALEAYVYAVAAREISLAGAYRFDTTLWALLVSALGIVPTALLVSSVEGSLVQFLGGTALYATIVITAVLGLRLVSIPELRGLVLAPPVAAPSGGPA
jgi:O-antigen/teichoic acid export membrane protein